jgi:hypothetical protein
MKRLVIGLIAGLAAGACNSAPDATRTANETGQGGTPAVATTGTGDKAPLEAARPTVREVTIPEGTELPIVLDTNVGSKTSRVEEPVRAHLSRAISVDGQPVLPEGSIVSGVVTDATPAAKVKGRAHLAVRFDSITPRGGDERYRIETAAVGRTAPATKKDDAIKIGAPAAGGAIIGAIVGGDKGAAIGAGIGGGAGTAVVLSTTGKETNLPVGSALRLRLTAPLTIRIRG